MWAACDWLFCFCWGGAIQWNFVHFGLHNLMSLCFLHAHVHLEGWQSSTALTPTWNCCVNHGFWITRCPTAFNVMDLYAICLHLELGSPREYFVRLVLVKVRLTMRQYRFPQLLYLDVCMCFCCKYFLTPVHDWTLRYETWLQRFVLFFIP